MSITTLEFLGFFAAVAVLNYVLPRVARPYFLLIASYAYFCYTPENRALVPVLLGATVVTWAAGLAIGKSKNRAVRVIFLLLAIFTAAGILLFYKYWDLFDLGLVNLAGLFGQRVEPYSFDLVAPLGLSYFTFAALSYTIDVFKRRCKVEYNILHYAMFVSFFPALITGPIERYPHLRPQIEKSRRFSYSRSAGGAFRMAWGYMKTGNIWVAVLMHFINNNLGLVFVPDLTFQNNVYTWPDVAFSLVFLGILHLPFFASKVFARRQPLPEAWTRFSQALGLSLPAGISSVKTALSMPEEP